MNCFTNETGAIEKEISYDAWGNRRDPATLVNYTTAPANLITDRGFTGHEHMEAFKLINMNGRMYDPLLGRFLSPDPTGGNTQTSQGFNRFSYVLNNSLSYTDPTGNFLEPIDYTDGEGKHDPIPYDPASIGFHRNTTGVGAIYNYHYNSSSGAYTNGYGDIVPFSKVMDDYIKPNSDYSISGTGALAVAQALTSGFDLYEVNAYGSTNYVLTASGKNYDLNHFLNPVDAKTNVGGITIKDLVINEVCGFHTTSYGDGINNVIDNYGLTEKTMSSIPFTIYVADGKINSSHSVIVNNGKTVQVIRTNGQLSGNNIKLGPFITVKTDQSYNYKGFSINGGFISVGMSPFNTINMDLTIPTSNPTINNGFGFSLTPNPMNATRVGIGAILLSLPELAPLVELAL